MTPLSKRNKKILFPIAAFIVAIAAYGTARQLSDPQAEAKAAADRCATDDRGDARTIIVVWDQSASLGLQSQTAADYIIKTLNGFIDSRDRLILRIINDAETAETESRRIRTALNRCRCRSKSEGATCLEFVRRHIQPRAATPADRERSRHFIEDLAAALTFPDDAGPRRYALVFSDLDKGDWLDAPAPLPEFNQVFVNFFLIGGGESGKIQRLRRLKKWRDWTEASGALRETEADDAWQLKKRTRLL